MSSFLKKHNISSELLILLLLYLLGSAGIAIVYITEVENSTFYHSILFLIVILINKYSLEFYNKKNKIKHFLFFSIVPSIIYLLLVIFFGEKYFLQYKLLITFPILLSFYQISKIVKIGR